MRKKRPSNIGKKSTSYTCELYRVAVISVVSSPVISNGGGWYYVLIHQFFSASVWLESPCISWKMRHRHRTTGSGVELTWLKQTAAHRRVHPVVPLQAVCDVADTRILAKFVYAIRWYGGYYQRDLSEVLTCLLEDFYTFPRDRERNWRLITSLC